MDAERWLLFVPMYNCAPQIGRTLAQITPDLRPRIAEVLVLDNGSRDGGPDRALDAARALDGVQVTVGRNDANYGLGGSHKAAFQYALDRGYGGVIVFHGDDQGRLSDLMSVVADRPGAACVLGARFMRGSQIQGYAPHRIAANIAFNALFSALSRQPLWDLGSGLNAYRRPFLERGLWRGCADDLTFNYHLILRTAHAGVPCAFVPISWREDDQISNAKLGRHGVQMLRILRQFGARDGARRRAFVAQDFSSHPAYTWAPYRGSDA